LKILKPSLDNLLTSFNTWPLVSKPWGMKITTLDKPPLKWRCLHLLPPREPKVSLPEKFSGTRNFYRGFINQLELVFLLQPLRYTTDGSKIATLGTLLTDKALAWYVPFLEKPELYQEELASWPLFKSKMAKTFGEIDQASVSANKLRKLNQGSGMVSHYAAEFRQLALDLDWNEPALINQYRFGLSDAVKDMLIHYDYPTNLNDFVDLTIKIDNRLFEHRVDRRRNNRVAFDGPVPRPQSPSVARASDAMDVDSLRRGPLSPAEREHRFKNGLCIVCGKAGHMKANCPVAVKRVAAMGTAFPSPEPSSGLTCSSTDSAGIPKNGSGQ
jgi:hypothetical protein